MKKIKSLTLFELMVTVFLISLISSLFLIDSSEYNKKKKIRSEFANTYSYVTSLINNSFGNNEDIVVTFDNTTNTFDGDIANTGFYMYDYVFSNKGVVVSLVNPNDLTTSINTFYVNKNRTINLGTNLTDNIDIIFKAEDGLTDYLKIRIYGSTSLIEKYRIGSDGITWIED